MVEEQLRKNIQQFFASAELVFGCKDYTSATILYFKTIFSMIDLILLAQQGRMPKDHTERFRMLEEHDPELYEFLDKYFTVYRNTYTMTIDQKSCEQVRANAKRIAERHSIQI